MQTRRQSSRRDEARRGATGFLQRLYGLHSVSGILHFCAAIVLVAAASISTTALSAPSETFPDNPGREIFEVICSSCHEPSTVVDKRWTREQWQSKVTEMLQEEVDVTEAERTQIVDYLARSFPRSVNVNSASAGDIARIVDLPADSAAAIVARRADKGPFKSLDEIKQVPGVDAAALEKRKDRLEF